MQPSSLSTPSDVTTGSQPNTSVSRSFFTTIKHPAHTAPTLLFERDGSIADDSVRIVAKALVDEALACWQFVLLVLDGGL